MSSPAGGDGSGGSDLRDGAWLLGTALLAALAVLYGAGLDALLDPAVPVFGDLGGHVVPIQELQSLLPRIHGWSHSWYGGFPLFYFYFPLPAVLAVAGASIIGLGPAMTAVVVAGPLLIPVAAAILVRASGGTRTGAFLAGSGSAYFVLARSLGISGGSLESALVGEFSYALGMALSLFYLASLPKLLERRSRPTMVLPVLLLCLTALSHVLATVMAVLGSLAFLRERRDFAPIAWTWGLAFLLSAWWSIPFLGYAAEMSTLAWAAPASDDIAAWLLEGVPVFALAILAMTWRSSQELPGPLYRLTALFLIAGAVPFGIPNAPIYPGRLLPYGFWAAHVLTAVVVWQALRSIWLSRRPRIRSALAVAGLGAVLGVGVLRGTARWTGDVMLRGTHAAEDLDSWKRLTDVLLTSPPGAVINAAHFPDPTGDSPMYLLNDHGARHLDRLTGHRIIGGLWQESSRSAPYATLAQGNISGDTNSLLALFKGSRPDMDRGITQARLLGARYAVLAGPSEFLRTRPAPEHARELARDSLWVLYEINDAAVAVEPAGLRPVTSGEFEEAARTWFEQGGESLLPVAAGRYPLPSSSGRGQSVASEISIEVRRSEIRVAGVTPHQPLLLRLSYFPSWKLASPGQGPYRAAPNHMIVVPESDSIRLIWRYGWLESMGFMATAFGGLITVLLIWTGLRFGRTEAAEGVIDPSLTTP